jgi:transcriptional regulator with XRE-family HTH domain
MNTGALIRRARLDSGLTQGQLAARLGVSQGAVAQLERAAANPTIATLERALRATEHRLELRLLSAEPSVDLTLLREALLLTPADRIAAAERLVRDADAIAASAARGRAKRKAGARR